MRYFSSIEIARGEKARRKMRMMLFRTRKVKMWNLPSIVKKRCMINLRGFKRINHLV